MGGIGGGVGAVEGAGARLTEIGSCPGTECCGGVHGLGVGVVVEPSDGEAKEFGEFSLAVGDQLGKRCLKVWLCFQCVA